jgi:hypothetical protein
MAKKAKTTTPAAKSPKTTTPQEAKASGSTKKSPKSATRRSSLEGLDIETDSSGEEDDEGGEEVLAYHESNEEEEAVDKKAEPTKGALKKASVFKSKSFFKLNNNLMLSGKISGRNLLPSNIEGKGGKRGGKGAPVTNVWKGPAANPIEEAQRKSAIYDPNLSAAPPLVQGKTKKEKTLGKGWFGMKPATLDSSMKGDIKMVEMRNYLDPKRFYKNPDKIRKVLHVGTVVEGGAEYTTARMSKKERKQSLVGEIIADKQIKDYTKRKYVEIQQEKEAKSGRKHKAKKLGQRDGHGSGSRKIRKLF